MKQDYRCQYNCLDATKIFLYIAVLGCVMSLVVGALFVVCAAASGVTYAEFVGTSAARYISIVIMPISYLVLYFVYHAKNKIVMFNKPRISATYTVLAVLLAGICVFALAPITNWICIGLESIGCKLDGEFTYKMTNWWQIVLGIIGYAVLPAVAEELLYRRVMLSGYLSKKSVLSSILIVATLFTLMHGSIRQFFYQIILGLVLTALGYVTRSVVYPIILHFINNATIIVLSLVGADYLVLGNAIFSVAWANILIYIAIFIIAVIFIVGVVLYIDKRNSLLQSNNNIIYRADSKLSDSEKLCLYMSLAISIFMWVYNTVYCFV